MGTAARPVNLATLASTVSSKFANRRGKGWGAYGKVRGESPGGCCSERSLPGSGPPPSKSLPRFPIVLGTSPNSLGSLTLFSLVPIPTPNSALAGLNFLTTGCSGLRLCCVLYMEHSSPLSLRFLAKSSLAFKAQLHSFIQSVFLSISCGPCGVPRYRR